MERCPWCLGNEKMIRYHDEEWGVPVHDDQKQFEFLMMEVMQCSLNWNMMIQKVEKEIAVCRLHRDELIHQLFQIAFRMPAGGLEVERIFREGKSEFGPFAHHTAGAQKMAGL